MPSPVASARDAQLAQAVKAGAELQWRAGIDIRIEHQRASPAARGAELEARMGSVGPEHDAARGMAPTGLQQMSVRRGHVGADPGLQRDETLRLRDAAAMQVERDSAPERRAQS